MAHLLEHRHPTNDASASPCTKMPTRCNDDLYEDVRFTAWKTKRSKMNAHQTLIFSNFWCPGLRGLLASGPHPKFTEQCESFSIPSQEVSILHGNDKASYASSRSNAQWNCTICFLLFDARNHATKATRQIHYSGRFCTYRRLGTFPRKSSCSKSCELKWNY